MHLICVLFLLIMIVAISITVGINVGSNVEAKYNISSGSANAPKCILKGFDIKALKSNSISKVEVYQAGTIYLELHCTAPYPIDFEFDGLPPRGNELRVKFANIFTDFTTFHVWITFIIPHSNPSGKYSVFSVDHQNDQRMRTSIYVFDSNNRAPQLFRLNDNELTTTNNGTSVIIGCRANVLDVLVLLYRYHRLDINKHMEQIGPSKSISYDPSLGFTLNIKTGQLLLKNDVEKYTYVCQCERCTKGNNSLEFKFPLNPTSSRGIKEESKTEAQITMDIRVDNSGEIEIICTNAFRLVPYATNIYAENPRQLSFTMGCLARNQRYSCSQKRTAGMAYVDTAILRPAHSRGLAQCSDQTDSRIKITREYFRGIDDVIYYEWTVALNSSNALLKIECQNEEKIYANLNYHFTCAFNSYILSPPSFFQLHYEDGSTQIHLYNPNYMDHESQRTRQVLFTLFANITKVSCSALPWNSSVFVNSSMDFMLRDKRLPKFNKNEENKIFVLKSTNTKLQCNADGDELPKIRWEKNGLILNETNLETKYEPGSSTIIFPVISHEHKGDYKCIAANSMGTSSKVYHVDVEDSHEIRTGSNYELMVGLPLAGLAILIITIIASYIIFRHFYRKRLYFTQEEIDEFKCGSDEYNNGGESGDQMRLMENIQYGPYDNKYEIHSSKFQIDRTCILGSGQFGIVYKGLYNHGPIAIKTLRTNTEKIYLKALLSELKVMIYINGHKNIVKLIGANTESLQIGMAYVFVEFCPLGSLETFLRIHQDKFENQIFEDGTISRTPDNVNFYPEFLYTKDLILWSYQISCGMEYLTCKKVIHGDLATRNILLLNRESVKITDFGLAKKLYDYATYERKHQVPIPWRWMAIESLQNLTFSTKTDVWSFGVTLWEIFSLANVPYPGLSWSPDFVKQLQFNMRMPQPDYAGDDIYDVMRRCWEIRPNDRPSFTHVKNFFSEYLKKFSPPTEYVDLFTDD